MNRFFLVFYFALLLELPTTAQHEYDHWFFGNRAGLDFSGGAPVADTAGMVNTWEGSTAISDCSGQLLFYTGGDTVYNRFHAVLSNGAGLNGGSSATQSSIIFRKPHHPSIYYLFTIADPPQPNGIQYHEIDMSLDNGLGELVSSDTLPVGPAVEKIAVIKHKNMIDQWVLVHGWNNNHFYAFRVSFSGVSGPVLSQVGSIHSGPGLTTANAIGCMKASPDGTKLALAISRHHEFELFDFDNATGKVSNVQILTHPVSGSLVWTYGVEFSPDGSKLYGTVLTSPSIVQYDLNANNISASATVVGVLSAGNTGTLQLGPDGKIYASKTSQRHLAAILSPNELGLACNYIDSVVAFTPRYCRFGLPLFPTFSTEKDSFRIHSLCAGDTAKFEFFAHESSIDSLHWNFGDPSSGIDNQANTTPAHHIYQQEGVYEVKLIVYKPCGTDTIVKQVTIESVLPEVDLGVDTLLCDGDSLVLEVDPGSGSLLWQDGSATQFQIVKQPGIYKVVLSHACGMRQDSVEVSYHPQPSIEVGNDTTICKDDSIVLHVNGVADQFVWRTGDTTTHLLVFEEGIYTVEGSNYCGTVWDTVYLMVEDPPVPNLGPDKILCEGESVVLSTGVINAEHSWQNGSTQPSISVNREGTYSVVLTNSIGCEASDTIKVEILSRSYIGYRRKLCLEETNELTSPFEFGIQKWNTGSYDKSVSLADAGFYYVAVEDTSICRYRDTAFFEVQRCHGNLYVPSAFTPNLDQKNEVFKVVYDGVIEQFELYIYNRWGELIFRTNDISEGWDGTFRGEPSPSGIYTWLIDYKQFKAIPQQKTGMVMLIR